MKMKSWMINSVLMVGPLFTLTSAFADGDIRKVDFIPGKPSSTLVLSYSGKGIFRAFKSDEQSNIIVEAEGLSLPAQLTRAIDVAGNKGPVVQITPYQSGGGKKNISKFVIQLRQKAEITATESSGQYILEIKGKGSAPAAVVENRAHKAEMDEVRNRQSATEKAEEATKKLLKVLNESSDEKVYSGSKVTFVSSNASVHDIFRLIGEASGLNIVTDSDVGGTSNYAVSDVPWDQLLDLVLQQSRLKAFAVGNVVRIIKLENYNKAEDERLQQLRLADQMEPVVMGVIPVSFATASDMKKVVENLLVKEVTSSTTSNIPNVPPPAPVPGNGQSTSVLKQTFARGNIEVDERSNALVVTNTKDAIERIRRLVKELDVPTPQVLIDSKIVIASETFAKNIGVQYGAAATSSGTGRAGVGLSFLGGTVQSVAATAGTPVFSVTGPTNGLGLGFQLGAGQHGNLNATLSLAEENSVAKTIASPRVIVNNKVAATITDGQTTYIQTTTTSNGVVTTTTTPVTTNLSLAVTPQVTSSGAVLLKVNVNKSAPAASVGENFATSTKNIQTEVMVDSGNTLVLGGVYQFGNQKREQGIPLLKDLPFIGQLFRKNQDSWTKDELMVFITPQIIEPTALSDSVGSSSAAPKNP